MNLILLFMLFFMVNSLEPKTRFCIDCKYFIPGNKNNYYTNYDKCSYFKITSEEEDNYTYLIRGIKAKTKYHNPYCSVARKLDYFCGPEGKYYEKE